MAKNKVLGVQSLIPFGYLYKWVHLCSENLRLAKTKREWKNRLNKLVKGISK